jgi:LPXTG-motif cell wall-anchored protein
MDLSSHTPLSRRDGDRLGALTALEASGRKGGSVATSRRWARVVLAVGLLLPAGAAGAQEAPEAPEAPAPRGSISIVKQAIPQRYQDFQFRMTGDFGSGAPHGFLLDDDDASTLPNYRVFTGLAPGVYTFTEVGADGWKLADIDCGGAAGTQRNGSTVSITITDQGENVTCVFVNEKVRPETVDVGPAPTNSDTSQPVVDEGPGRVLPDLVTNAVGDAAPVGETAKAARELRVLPRTGPSAGSVLGGLGLIAAGALLLAADRRRSRRRVDAAADGVTR